MKEKHLGISQWRLWKTFLRFLIVKKKECREKNNNLFVQKEWHVCPIIFEKYELYILVGGGNVAKDMA